MKRRSTRRKTSSDKSTTGQDKLTARYRANKFNRFATALAASYSIKKAGELLPFVIRGQKKLTAAQLKAKLIDIYVDYKHAIPTFQGRKKPKELIVDVTCDDKTINRQVFLPYLAWEELGFSIDEVGVGGKLKVMRRNGSVVLRKVED